MSWFLRRFALIAVPVVEVVLIIFVADQIGWLATLGLLAGGVVVGLLLIRAAGRNAFQLLRNRVGTRVTTVDPVSGETTTLVQPPAPATPERRAEDAATVREAGLLVTAGLLVAVPGFLSDVVGLTLALPGVRRTLAARAPAGPGVLIAGETVVVDDSGVRVARFDTDLDATRRPTPGPDVIAGEILPPQVHPNE